LQLSHIFSFYMMIRSIFIIFLIFNFTCAVAQELKGSATYAVSKSTDSTNNDSDELMILQAHPFIPEIVAGMEFQMQFDEKQSLFALVKNKALEKIDSKNLRIAEIMIGYKDSTWQDGANSYIFERDLSKGLAKKSVIQKSPHDFNWKIQKESKLIGNYTCYQAIGHIVLGKGNKARQRPVIAWFCPEIPVSFGPINSGGLPGLIFEYQYAGTVFGLTKINWHEQMQVPTLPAKEIVTKQELQDRVKQIAKERGLL